MGENLNNKNQWGEPQKGGAEPNFEISVGEAKGGNTIFHSNLLGGKTLEETMKMDKLKQHTEEIRDSSEQF